MPEKLYTGSSMGGGLQVINSPDPVNPQDLATKNYVDNRNQFGPYVPLWEQDYSMQCGSFSCGAGNFHLTTGPIDQTITKRYPDTAIRVIANMSCYISVVGASMWMYCSINGGALTRICGLLISTTGEHTTFPVGIVYFPGSAGPGSYLGSATGPMTVAWYMSVSTNSPTQTIVYTDANDAAAWTMAEVKTS
jgi:hypothetical protein